MKLTLTIHDGTPRVIEAGATVLIGSGRAADVRVPDSALAPLHLRLTCDGAAVTAWPTAAGVELDDRPLAVDEPALVTGHRLRVGPLVLVVVPWQVGGPVATDSLARELARDLLGSNAPPPHELVVERGPGQGQLRPLPAGERVLVGRGAEATWIILDPALSRVHVGFCHRADGVYAWDAGARNGATVDGVALPTAEPGRVLAPDDRVILGDTTLWLRDPAALALAGLERAAGARDPAAGAATVTRDLPRPAPSTAAPSPPAPRPWLLWIAASVAAVALGLAALVLATW